MAINQMQELVESFPNQILEAMDIGEKSTLSNTGRAVRNVVVSGLGGSGIGGTILSEIVAGKSTIPIYTNKDYSLPAYVNKTSLIIISSYSGNTEETLAVLHEAIKRNASLVCISSGGDMLKIAKNEGIEFIEIPGGMPPRACLAYSFIQLLYILNHFEIIDSSFKDDLKKSAKSLEDNKMQIMDEARGIAHMLHGKIPVIYASSAYEGTAIRFRQQLNENAKMLCWHHVFPEMNHNELVGWKTVNDELAVVMFRDTDDFYRIRKRMDICKSIFAKYTTTIVEIYTAGDSLIEKTFRFIHIGDWISCYLSSLNNVDTVEVKVIDYLKGELEKIG